MKKIFLIRTAVAIIAIMSAIVRASNPWIFFTNCGLATILIGIIVLNQKRLMMLGLSLIICQFLFISWFESGEIRNTISREPKAELYAHDTMMYLKTYYLMNRGMPYHQAVVVSYDQDMRTTGNPPDLWGFRLPTVFYFWHVATYGQPLGIYMWFLILGCLSLVVSYKISGSLIAPALLAPYLLVGSTTQEFLQMEWWGILPLLIFLYGIFNKRYRLIILGASLAVLCRETYALPITGVLLTACILRDWRIVKSIITAGLLVFIVFLFHASAVFRIIALTPEHIFSGRQHILTLEFVHQVLAFATQRYLFGPFRLFSVYVIACIVLTVRAWKMKSNNMPIHLYLIIPILISLVAFLKIGLCCWSDYWGVMIGPLITTAMAVNLELLHD